MRSPTLPVLAAFLLLSAGVEGQAGLSQTAVSTRGSFNLIDSTRFLWYTGHWSTTKKNVFIVGTPGSTLTIGDDGAIHVSGGSVDAWNKWVDQAQKTVDQTVQLLNNPADNQDPATHILYEMMTADADSQKVRVARLKIKPTEDLLSQDLRDVPLRKDQVTEYCRQAESTFEEVMAFYENNIKNQDDNLKVPPPPQFDYDCYSCDSTLRDEYEKRITEYVLNFREPEHTIIQKAFVVLHKLAISGFLIDQGGLNNFEGCGYLDIEELSNAAYQTARHLHMRGDKLVSDNASNFQAATAITRVYLGIQRDWLLLAGGTPGTTDMLGELDKLYGKAVDHYMDELKHNDWRQIGNLPIIISTMRDYELLGGKDYTGYLGQLQKIMNGFELSIDMNIKIGNEIAHKWAHLKGKCHIMPEFSQDKDRCYTWVVAQEDLLSEYGMLRKQTRQTIDCQLITNELTTPPPAPKITYTGTKKYTVELKGLRMDFCHPGHDTIFLNRFTPNPADAGIWTTPYSPPQNLGVNGMEEFFESIQEKEEESQSGETSRTAKDLEQQARAIQAQMKAINDAQAAAKAGTANGENAQEKIQEETDKLQALTTTPALATALYISLLLPVQNNNSVLVDKPFSAKEINPGKASEVILGTYTVHIENNENGKTKTLPPPQ
jgi:hypothetical protein